MQWSSYQQAYFDWVKTGKGNAVVLAVAGAGKTTVLVEGSKHMAGSVASAMYNKKNATEFQARLQAAGIGNNQHRAGTFHSFGFSAVRRVFPATKVDEREKAKRLIAELKIPEALQTFAIDLVSLAKQAAFGLLASPDDESAWWALVRHHDLDADLEEPERAAEGIGWARKALRLSREIAKEVIDFDDMVYLPAVTNMRVWQNDWLLVDEAQDTNPARRTLARKMLRPGGRAVFVGDPAQAIYGFTGADNDSIDLIRQEFGAVTLPLTISYRCPRAVVTEARALVPHIEPHPGAAEGEVRYAEERDLFSTKTTKKDGERVPPAETLGATDAVLCRKTAPLVRMAFRLIKDGTPCHVEGREIGGQLAKLAGRWRKVHSTVELRKCVEAYRDEQVAKLMAKGSEAAAAALDDRCETLLVLMEDCEDADCLRRKLTTMFQDGAPTLTLSTVHKAKGREWDRVYLLGRGAYMPSPWARQSWQQEQERNLIYVALTRAKATLTYVEPDVA